MKKLYLRSRLGASLAHLGLSALLISCVAVCIFKFWYPTYYADLSGGGQLFWVLVAVDVALGPLITFFIFSLNKPIQVLCRDLVVVGVIQMLALGYGVWVAAMARPIHLVFEIDRFRVVHAADVDSGSVFPARVKSSSWSGPTLLGLRPFVDSREKIDATMDAVAGIQLAFRPKFWQPYDWSVPDVISAAKPMAALAERFPQRSTEIEYLLRASGYSKDAVLYLPLIGRNAYWTVFIDSTTAAIVLVFPLDSFEQ